MSRVRAIQVARLHVILCFAFDHHAPGADIESYQKALIECPDVCHSIEASGAFDFMVEFDVPDLQSYNECLKQLVQPLPPFVVRYEANFVVRRFVRARHQEARDLWVPCRDGMRRIDSATITTVHAEGDYVRVRSGEQNWLLHLTMSAISERLDPELFIRLHRSTIVRCALIERLTHRDGRWYAQLFDGTTQRIAKSHVAEALRVMRGDSAAENGASALRMRVKDTSRRPTESPLPDGSQVMDMPLAS